MRSDEIAALMTAGLKPPAGDSDIGLHVGTVLTWDRQSGVNSVSVNGTTLTNLDALQGGIPNAFAANDVVLICRKQSRYFILGKVASPGGLAGSAPAFQTMSASVNYTASTGTYGDLTGQPVGPQVSTYVSSTRTAFVLWQCDVDCYGATGEIGWTVSGASSISAGAFTGMSIKSGTRTFNGAGVTVQTYNTATGQYLMGPGAGLNTGLNTFTMKYKATIHDASGFSTFKAPGLTVIPL
jgi:hypothetical protein